MKIQYPQLSAHLTHKLAPLYLIGGEEILFLQEAEEMICQAAKKSGFNECVRFSVDAKFDWSFFQQAIQNTSIFSDKQILVLNLTSGKLSDAGKKILTTYFTKPFADKLLIIRAGKLDAATQKTVWYKAADKIGVTIPIWPLMPAQISGWIQQRLQGVDLQANLEGLQLLAMRTEGNLLATAQEIEKLGLLYAEAGKKKILTLENIEEASSNNARYTVFNLADVILQGKPLPIVQVLRGLKEEAIEPILILWALTREARQWAQWLQQVQAGKTLAQILVGNFWMEKRKPLIMRTLQQHTINSLYECLQLAADIDQMIKGVVMGNVWDELDKLALELAAICCSR